MYTRTLNPRIVPRLAMAMAVFPLLASTTSVPGTIIPLSMAERIMFKTGRSLIDMGFLSSSFASTLAGDPGNNRLSSRSGVFPMHSLRSRAMSMVILPCDESSCRMLIDSTYSVIVFIQ